MENLPMRHAVLCAVAVLCLLTPASCRKAPSPPTGPTAQQVEDLVLEGKTEEAVDLILAQPDLSKPEVLPAVLALAETTVLRGPLAYPHARSMSKESMRKFLKSPPDLSKFEWAIDFVRPLDADRREFYDLAYLSDPPDIEAMRKKMSDKTGKLRHWYFLRLAELNDSLAWSLSERIWSEEEVLGELSANRSKLATLTQAYYFYPRWAQEKLLRIVAAHWKGRYNTDKYAIEDVMADSEQMQSALNMALKAYPKIDSFLKDIAKREIPESIVAKAGMGDSRTIAAARRLANRVIDYEMHEKWKHMATLAAAGVPEYERYALEGLKSPSEGPFKHDGPYTIIECGGMLPEPRGFRFLRRVALDQEQPWYHVGAARAELKNHGRKAYPVLVELMKGDIEKRHKAAGAIIEIEYRLGLEEHH